MQLKASHTTKQARKLRATLVRNYHSLTRSLTGVKCRATSVAKKLNATISHVGGYQMFHVCLYDISAGYLWLCEEVHLGVEIEQGVQWLLWHLGCWEMRRWEGGRKGGGEMGAWEG